MKTEIQTFKLETLRKHIESEKGDKFAKKFLENIQVVMKNRKGEPSSSVTLAEVNVAMSLTESGLADKTLKPASGLEPLPEK